jgi:hypothetical protein
VVNDVTGRTIAILKVQQGRAMFNPTEHSMKDGMYILRSGSGETMGKLILTE